MANNMQDLPEHIHCQNCGFCCCVVPITSSEDLGIRQYLKAMDKAVLDRLAHQPRSNDECQFRDREQRRCAIYPARPRICRMFGVVLGMDCLYGNTSNLNIRHLLMAQPLMLMPEYIACNRINACSIPLAKLPDNQERFKKAACLIATAEAEQKYGHHARLFQCSIERFDRNAAKSRG